MIVIIAGMPRSGSTLVYNIAREFLSSRGEVKLVLSNSLALPPELSPVQTKTILLKSHAPDREITDLIVTGQAFCICTIRKPEDAMASWIDAFKFSLDESLLHFEAWLKWHSSVSNYSLNIDFDKIENNLIATTRTIGTYLIGDVSHNEIQAISCKYRKDAIYRRFSEITVAGRADMIDCGFSFYERDTLFHRRHVASLVPRGANELLSPDQVLRIRHHLNRYLDSDGNYQWARC